MKFSLAVSLFLPVVLFAAGNAYVGRDVCATCHKSTAAVQATTAMARTWQGPGTSLLPKTLQEQHAEGPDPKIEYRVTRDARDFGFTVQMPGSRPQQFPIWTTMGGTR